MPYARRVGCEIGRDRGLPIALPIAEGGPMAVEGVKQRSYSIQSVEGATKVASKKAH